VARVRTDVSEELSASIIRVTRIGEPGTLAVTSNRRTLRRHTKYCTVLYLYKYLYSCYPDDGGDKFLSNVGSYKSHTSQHF
jgi:hypothetical protein